MSVLQRRAPETSAAFHPTVALSRLAGFAAAGTALAGLAATTGVGLPCPWRSLTGTLCPLCGATHLGVRLLQLDPGGAFAANQFVFVGLVVLAVLGGAWSVEALGGPKLRPPRPLRVGADRWYLAIAVIGVGFAVLRNLR